MRHPRSSFWTGLFLFAALTALFVSSISAQLVGGTINGTVLDASNAAVDHAARRRSQ